MRRGIWSAAIAAIGLSGLGVLSAGAESMDAPLPIRVMSFNIRYAAAQDGGDSWSNRRDALLSTIREFGPDLLGTQECLKEQGEWLLERLPEYGFVGVGREDGRQGGEMCAIFYRRGRFEEAASGHFWLSETPDSVGSRGWDCALPRMVTWVQLRERGDSLSMICHFNTHFDHVGVEGRRRSAELLRARILQVAGDLPVLVTGDFNAPADTTESGPYRILCAGEEPRLIDCYRALHATSEGEGTYHAFRGETEGARIDWILVAPDHLDRVLEASIIRTKREGRWPSDHYPVTSEMRFLH